MATSGERKTDDAYTDHHVEPNYIAVFVALFVFTLIEVGMTYLPIPQIATVIFLIALAIVKAALVALFFMHLKFDSRLLTPIFVVPLSLGTVLIIILML